MPASLFHEPEAPGNGLEDQRALQLALELSMLGLTTDEGLGNGFEAEARAKKSQNTTECVPVPSSEHVAEIVGRQGCKIKALRAKTNTYIKTPVRGEEPVFVVTGRKEDVNAAKREILSAAEHFSQIRAQRKNNLNGSLAGPGPNSNIPGQTTIQVRVPYRVVGLVVGPKGATIKRIQQQTNTYIITPSRDKEPIFEVTGLPENVETARKEIEAHIAMRTGGIIDSTTGTSNGSSAGSDTENGHDFSSGSPLNGLNGVDHPFSSGSSNGFGSLYKAPADPFAPFPSARDNNLLISPRSQDIFSFNMNGGGSSKFGDIYSSFSNNGFNGTSTNGNGFGGLYETDEGIGESPTFDSIGAVTSSSATSMWPEFASGQNRCFSSTISPLGRRSSSLGSQSDAPSTSSTTSSTTPGATGSGNDSGTGENGEHPPARRICSDPMSSAFAQTTTTVATSLAAFSTGVSGSTSTSSSPTESLASLGSLNGGPIGSGPGSGNGGRKPKRDCIVCFEGEITAALVPCGHNLFCMECANRVCGQKSEKASCPVCHQPAAQAIRIYS